MRRFLISTAVAAAATLTVAVPASAQYHQGYGQGGYGQRGYNHNGYNRQAVNQLMRDLDRVESRIQRGVQRGTLSPREANGLQREAGNIRHRLHRAGRDGLSQREVYELRQRIDRLEQRLRYERHDRDGRRW